MTTVPTSASRPRARWGLAGGLALALTLVGCGGECEELWYPDLDGDGYGDPTAPVAACRAPDVHVDNGRDCDDADARIHPGAGERCNGLDDDCDQLIDGDVTLTWFLDRDGDGYGDPATFIADCDPPPGYVADDSDCDDLRAEANPEGVEVCNGADDDCDALTDEDPLDPATWYRDADEDGFGDPTTAAAHCTAPDGWVADADDCDDTDPLVHPEAGERCNGVDDDCDDLIDAADPELTGGTRWYRDADGDGFGTPFASVEACIDGPVGYVDNDLDCLDTDPAVNPDAVETCAVGDEDCDDLHGDADPSVDPASLSPFWTDADGDGLGGGVARWACAPDPGEALNGDDCDDADADVGDDTWRLDGDGDGFGVGPIVAGSGCLPPTDGYANAAAPTDCDDGDPGRSPGLVEVCDDGIDQDCTGVDGVCPAPLAGTLNVADAAAGRTGLVGGDGLGAAVAGVDLDGDGRLDLAVGAPDEARGGSPLGAVWLLAGPPPEIPGSWDAAGSVVGDLAGSEAGAALAPAGDLDGDGFDDLLVGLPGRGAGGALGIVHGGLSSLTGPSLTLLVEGPTATADLGRALAAPGDLDADGIGEIFVGGPGDDGAGVDAGAVWLLSSDQASIVPVDTVASLTVQGLPGSASGSALAAGDPDGDGVIEVLIGAPGADLAWLVDATLTGTVSADTASDASLVGAFGSEAGASLGMGDLDGDGLDDLIVGAPAAPGLGTAAGEVRLVAGDALGSVTLDTTAVGLLGEVDGERLGAALSLGDVDGDGQLDLIAGAPGAHRVHVLHGPLTGLHGAGEADAVLLGTPTSALGAAVSSPGDLDGDGLDDVVVGGPGHDTPATDAGGMWLFRGY